MISNDEFVKEICENKEAIFSILRRKFSLSENTETKSEALAMKLKISKIMEQENLQN